MNNQNNRAYTRNSSIDFKRIAAAALTSAKSLLQEWLPGGRFEGHEYVALNPTRNDRSLGSFKINLQTGRWSDFADPNAKGRDLISLFAYINGLDHQSEAALQIAERLGMPVPKLSGAPASANAKKRDASLVMPAPADAPAPPTTIAYGIGESFRPLHPTPWLADGRTWQDHLPWVRRMEEYKVRPTCSVEKEWFKVAAKKLRPLADVASPSDLLWFAFDGEALRIAGCGVAVILPATGTAWDLRYAIKGTQLDHLPTRLPDPVVIGVWEGTLSVGRRVWTLAQSEQLDPLSSAREPNVNALAQEKKKKTTECSINIAQQERPGIRTTVWAYIQPDGGLRLDGGDIGERVEQIWGDEDYEYWVEVPGSEIGKLLLLLLKEKYNGNINAVDEFKAFCESNGIICQFMNWI
jgi:hypothetical protein